MRKCWARAPRMVRLEPVMLPCSQELMVAHSWPSLHSPNAITSFSCSHGTREFGNGLSKLWWRGKGDSGILLRTEPPTSMPWAPSPTAHTADAPQGSKRYKQGRLKPHSAVIRSMQVERGEKQFRGELGLGQRHIVLQWKVYDHQSLSSLHAHPKQ